MEAQIEASREKRAAAEERVALIHKSLEQTEAEIAREESEITIFHYRRPAQPRSTPTCLDSRRRTPPAARCYR